MSIMDETENKRTYDNFKYTRNQPTPNDRKGPGSAHPSQSHGQSGGFHSYNNIPNPNRTNLNPKQTGNPYNSMKMTNLFKFSHCDSCNKCVENDPKEEFDILEYLRGTQRNEYNEYNRGDEDQSNLGGYPEGSNNAKINEMLILTNLVFYKGTELAKTIKKQGSDLENLKSECEKQQRQLEEKERLEEELTKHKKELEITSNELLDLKKRSEQLGKDNESLEKSETNNKKEIAKLKLRSDELDDLKEKHKETQSLLRDLEEYKKSAESKMKAFDSIASNLEKTIEEYKGKYNASNEENKGYCSEIAALNKKLSSYEKEVNSTNELIIENGKLKEEIFNLEHFSKEVKQLTSQLEGKEREKNTLSSLCKNLETELANYKAFLQEKEQELSRRNSKSANLETEIRYLKENLDSKSKLISDLEKRLDIKCKEEVSNFDQIKDLQVRLSTVGSADEVRKLKQKLKSMSETNTNLADELNILKQEKSVLLKQTSGKKNSLDYEVNLNTLHNDTSFQNSPKRQSSLNTPSRKKETSSDNLGARKSVTIVGETNARKSISSGFNSSNTASVRDSVPVHPSPKRDIPKKSMIELGRSGSNMERFEADYMNIWQNGKKAFWNDSDAFETISLKSNLPGNWKVTIRINKMSHGVHLGICSKRIELSEISKRNFLGKNPGDYALNLYSGYLWRNDKKYQKIEKTFKSGDLVEMAYENGNLIFRSGSFSVTAFKSVGEGMYPAATITNRGDAIEIISVEVI